MNNNQLAAARRVANRYPQFRMVQGDATLTPYNGETAGQSVTILPTTSPDDLARALNVACVVLANG